jgi:hypothetical protein
MEGVWRVRDEWKGMWVVCSSDEGERGHTFLRSEVDILCTRRVCLQCVILRAGLHVEGE